MTVKEFDKLSKRDFANGAVLDEIRTELKKAEKWRKVKEIAKTTDCYPICPFVDFCANSDIPCCFGVIVDALEGEEEKEDAS